MTRTPFRITDMRVLGALAPQTGDTAPPTVPANVVATAINAGRVDLSWTASTDDFGVAGYQIFRNGTPLNTAALTTYTDSTCQPSTFYSYVIVAFDAAGNNSAASSAGTATTPANAAPVWQSIPAQTLIIGNAYLLTLTDYCTDADLDSLTFTITSGTLPTGITLSGTRLQGTPTTAGQTPTITVQAADQFHQISTTIAFSTKTADVTAPPVPTGLAATAVSSSQINVSWNASTDAAGGANELVSGTKDYRVYRDGVLRTTVTTTTFSDTGLSASTQYAYRVSARDNALNESAQAAQVTATTQAANPNSLTHGALFTFSGTGLGTKTNFNTAGLTWNGHTYMNYAWTDTPALAANGSSQAAFQAALGGGFYPAGGNSVGGFTFNPTPTSDNMSIQTGGPSQSGKYFQKTSSSFAEEGYLQIQMPGNSSTPANSIGYWCCKVAFTGAGKISRFWVDGQGSNGHSWWHDDSIWANDTGVSTHINPGLEVSSTFKRLEIFSPTSTTTKVRFNGTNRTVDGGATSFNIFRGDTWRGSNSNGTYYTWPNSLDSGGTAKYTDIYFDFEVQRVELSQGSVSEIQLPVAWSSTSITIAVNRGALSLGSATLKVFNSSDTVVFTTTVTLV